ncbi:MAG: diguanylate cyclase [Mariprofundus sp.]|nr:diguanylate cyclase [Mariprofundus sp.]
MSLNVVGADMNTLREDPHRAVIIGAGDGGTAILEMLLEENLVTVVAMVDIDPCAPGLHLAKSHGIPIYANAEEALKASVPCVAFNMTHNEMLEAVVCETIGAGGMIGGMESQLIWRIISNMKAAKAELHFQATHDALTGLYNRRYIMEQLHRGVSESLRYGHAFSVVMIDLDHFKQVNDVYGHSAGDMVLSTMAKVLNESVRESDTAGRWGGEEFLVLLPHTDLAGAKDAAEQWLERISTTPLHVGGGDEAIYVSFSGGVALLALTEPLQDADSPNIDQLSEALLHAADLCMYQAKESGRKRVLSTADKTYNE